ncbi:FAD-binding protein [Streptomyces sp. NPDC002795]|uniref:FAD-binding protein n=1 Tax=Streptomyces sp. NPDC002795 TaxID=3364665 RepID=UPI0036C05E10
MDATARAVASNYRVVPGVVVRPRTSDGVLAALDIARDTGVPLTSRGGGTSIAGNAAADALTRPVGTLFRRPGSPAR